MKQGGNESRGYSRSRFSALVLSQTLGGKKKSRLMASFWKAQES